MILALLSFATSYMTPSIYFYVLFATIYQLDPANVLVQIAAKVVSIIYIMVYLVGVAGGLTGAIWSKHAHVVSYVLFWRLSDAIFCPSFIPPNFGNNGSGRPLWHGGGIDRAFRRIFVISAAASGPSADTKCQFSGSLPHSRVPIQRESCNLCNKCSDNCNIYSILNICGR